jgi:hypothetical protein
VVESLLDLANKLLLRGREEFDLLFAQWQAELADLGSDPLTIDWIRFRSLRVSREEDWSDWLAFLLETSVTGVFADVLFGAGAPSMEGTVPTRARPQVDREMPTLDRVRRTDLLIRWRTPAAPSTHVEVKIWDRELDKTVDTAERLAEETETFILLPTESRATWNETRKRYGDRAATIKVLTWDDVAVGLRASLRAKDESIVWRAWALAFCGAVQQRILGHTIVDPSAPSGTYATIGMFGILTSLTTVLRKGLHDARR